MKNAKRIVLARDASAAWRRERPQGEPWLERAGYPARWIHPDTTGSGPAFSLFSLKWTTRGRTKWRLHVSADERYRLWCDDLPCGEGPERGHVQHWKFESYDLELEAGAHELTALVWSLDAARPWAQTSVQHGFLLWPEALEQIAAVTTGVAPWQCRKIHGISLVSADKTLHCAPGSGPGFAIDESQAKHGPWTSARVGAAAICAAERLCPCRVEHALEPAELPAQATARLKAARVVALSKRQGHKKWRLSFEAPVMPDDALPWEKLWIKGGTLQIGAEQTVELVFDLGQYECGFPLIGLEATGSREAQIEMLVVEAPFDDEEGFTGKSRRDDMTGRYFRGVPDRFFPAPDRKEMQEFSPLWWRAGRFLLLRIFTGSHGLQVYRVGWKSTGYPLRLALPSSSDPALQKIVDVSAHTLQRCAHETYMDCPYYEQLMYAGDGRIECLLTYCASADVYLPRKALRLFDQSRANARGLPTDAVPGPHKIIPPFALWWVAMIYDYALWHGEPVFVNSLLPGARQVADQFLAAVTPDGLAHQLEGWNFYDWCWPGGIPPGGKPGEASALLQWHLVLVLRQLEEMESWCGQPERASVWRAASRRLVRAAEKFWSPRHRLYGDTLARTSFSQHTQSLALLTKTHTAARRTHLLHALFDPAENVTRAGGYFTHYVFEALLQEKRADAFLAGLQPWREALDQGFTTFPETFGQTRSDCHAWNAHPLYHTITGLAGLRPTELGGRTWQLNPCLPLPGELSLKIPRPGGSIELDLKPVGAEWTGRLVVPAGFEIVCGSGVRQRRYLAGRHALRFSTTKRNLLQTQI